MSATGVFQVSATGVFQVSATGVFQVPATGVFCLCKLRSKPFLEPAWGIGSLVKVRTGEGVTLVKLTTDRLGDSFFVVLYIYLKEKYASHQHLSVHLIIFSLDVNAYLNLQHIS